MATNIADTANQLRLRTGQDGRKTKRRQTNHPGAMPTITPEPKLFEKLGSSMVDLLVRDLQAPHDTPTLLDRLRNLGIINVQLVNPQKDITTPVKGQHFSNLQRDVFKTVTQDQIQHKTSSDCTSASSTLHSMSSGISERKRQNHGNIFTLGDFAAVYALDALADEYGRVSHMGILDQSYSFFITKDLDAALYFKVKNNICLVGGDPLCPEKLYPELLEQFAQYRRKHHWGIIFVGASDTFVSYAEQQNWTTLQFGSERVLNPVTNPVLREETAKRIATQNRQLLNPSKGGITLGIYNPSIVKDVELEKQLVAVYDAWRDARNQTQSPQAFITVYDPFAIPGLMTYIYTKDHAGTPNGFAALRRIGANNGFHIDPCVPAPSAPRGISDLLIFSSMALLNAAGCTYLSFGYEPLTQPGEISGMPSWVEKVTRKTHKSVFKGLKVSGKKVYHDKWCPDETQSTGLHLVFPSGTPGIQHIIAVMHFANISIKSLLSIKMKKMVGLQKDSEVSAKNTTNMTERERKGKFEGDKIVESQLSSTKKENCE
ncbi:hypothetical protein B7463_g3381, partial [Scytalidium lignicola]